ncbi:MAG: enoyl-CoA hydratase/isomerase family protein [Desulfurococcales archaeon]|nr:enoyl-CoA hydratase/isomerase family protein [Desulfurococcales archaeon]
MPVDPSLRVEGRIAWISLGSPGILGIDSIRRLIDLAREAEASEEAKIIAITGEGKYFSVGADLKHVASASSPDEASRLFKELASLFRKLLSLEKPVILGINGDAYGGGAELVWTGDIVVAVRGARLYWVEARWGLVPPMLTVLGPHILGHARALYHAMTGEPMSVEEAYQAGIVSRLVDSREELEDEIRAITSRIMENSPQAVYSVRRIARASLSTGLAELGISELVRLSMTSEARRAAKSFAEKKRPSYDW